MTIYTSDMTLEQKIAEIEKWFRRGILNEARRDAMVEELRRSGVSKQALSPKRSAT